jgi:phage tail sheath protein FI
MTADDPQRQCVNVWRLFIFLEEAIHHGTQLVVFESNDETI